MSEFTQTMRNWKRMCHYYEELDEEDPCAICCLHGNNCAAIWEMDDNTDWEERAELINVWAAEHPEPTYLTWAEWFHEIGVAPREQKVFHAWLLEPIPANIAQKLELSPKKT